MKQVVGYTTTVLRCMACLAGMLCLYPAYAQTTKSEWLDALNKTIPLSAQYDVVKLKRIDSLHRRFGPGKNAHFDYYHSLYDEYSVFNFDSAWHYAKKMQEAASELNSASLGGYARIKLCLTLLSSGMFKEVFDSLRAVDFSVLSPEGKAQYYILKAKSYFDLADYANNETYTRQYNAEAGRYLDSSLSLFPASSFEYHYYAGLRYIRAGTMKSATEHFKKLVADKTLSLHQRAIAYSTYSDLYIRKGMPDSAIILLAKAAIADIQSSTRETSAIFTLATILFKRGELEDASAFIRKASTDATKFGARQRMVQLSAILPLIESARLRTIEEDRLNIINYAFIITLLSLFLVALVFTVIRQVKKLKKQQEEISKKNLSLHHLVEEKEWLLKEIHHRVKNNLHTITSLLESQSAYLENDALEAIRNSQHRVFAMSLIHQRLYKTENNVTSIDMSAYLKELTNYLEDSFETRERIQFEWDIEPVWLDISLATPLGLILNEAITNAVKYAFPDEEKGTIAIGIQKTGENTFIFTVADNGRGLPGGFDVENSYSLGMRLMKGLSEDIGASFTISSERGTRISIGFSPAKVSRPVPELL